jgi:hypothetical protein
MGRNERHYNLQETYHWIISPLKYIHVILFTHSTYVQIVNLLNKEKNNYNLESQKGMRQI